MEGKEGTSQPLALGFRKDPDLQLPQNCLPALRAKEKPVFAADKPLPFGIGLNLLKKRKTVWTKAVLKYVLIACLTGASGKRVDSCLWGYGGGTGQRQKKAQGERRQKKRVSQRG